MGTSCCKEDQDVEEGAAPFPTPRKQKAASPKKAKDEKGAFKKKYILGGKLGSVR